MAEGQCQYPDFGSMPEGDSTEAHSSTGSARQDYVLGLYFCKDCKHKWSGAASTGACPKCAGTRLNAYSFERHFWIEHTHIANCSTNVLSETSGVENTALTEYIYTCQGCYLSWRTTSRHSCSRCGGGVLIEYGLSGNEVVQVAPDSELATSYSESARAINRESLEMNEIGRVVGGLIGKAVVFGVEVAVGAVQVVGEAVSEAVTRSAPPVDPDPVPARPLGSTPLTDLSAHGLAEVAGMHELKQMLMDEVIQPLRNPDLYRKYRIEIPNGILMYGPPGCGKTYIARQLAAELQRNFYEVSPGEVASSYVHGSTQKIRQLFESAAKNAPALMFVDEFEGLVPSRRSLGGEQQYKSEEVNEWLIQLGKCAEKQILFVAATNEPWAIDDAVQRSGRIDKKVYVGPPDVEAIEEMLLHHLKGRPFSSRDDVKSFSMSLAGQRYAASDLKVLADEAAKLAMRAQEEISLVHLSNAAADRVRPSISRETEQLYREFRHLKN